MTDTTQADAGAAATSSDAAAQAAETDQIWNEFEAAEKTPEQSAADASRAEDVKAAEDETRGENTEGKAADEAATGKTGADGEDDADGSSQAAQEKSGAGAQDIWANATPEQKAAFEKLKSDQEAAATRYATIEQENRSNRGRLAALQRQVKELSGKDAKPEAGEASDAKAAVGLFETDEWKAFKDEYPELAAQQEKALKPILDTVEGMKRDVKGITQERTEQEFRDQFQIALNDHPDLPEIAQSDAFMNWYRAQPAYVQQEVQRVTDEDKIIDGAGASHIIAKFKADTNWKPSKADGGKTGAGKGKDDGQPASTSHKDGGQSQTQAREPSRTETRREAQLESSAGPRTQGQGAVTDGVPDDPDAAWEHFERKGL